MKLLTKTQDYAVDVITLETDENGIPWGTTVSVRWDGGIEPDWDGWLENYNEFNDEPVAIANIVKIEENEEF